MQSAMTALNKSIFSSCGKAPKEAGKIRIAGIVFQEDQFFRMVELGMKDAAARLDVELDVGNTRGALDREASLVDTYLAEAQFAGQRVRLCGTVGQEGLEINSAELRTRFHLLGRQGRVPVLYEGVLPDMFKAGADIVAEGKCDEAGVFRATSIMTKCASKYRPADFQAAPEPAP